MHLYLTSTETFRTLCLINVIYRSLACGICDVREITNRLAKRLLRRNPRGKLALSFNTAIDHKDRVEKEWCLL